MFGFGMTELLVILAIVLLIFGPKRLKSIGSDLGGAIKGFRNAVTDEDDKADAATQADASAKIIEGEATTASKSTAGSSQDSKAPTNG